MGKKKLDGIVASFIYKLKPSTIKRQGIMTATFKYGTDSRRSVKLGFKVSLSLAVRSSRS
jgi:hypothetical protein